MRGPVSGAIAMFVTRMMASVVVTIGLPTDESICFSITESSVIASANEIEPRSPENHMTPCMRSVIRSFFLRNAQLASSDIGTMLRRRVTSTTHAAVPISAKFQILRLGSAVGSNGSTT